MIETSLKTFFPFKTAKNANGQGVQRLTKNYVSVKIFAWTNFECEIATVYCTHS